MVEVVLTSAVIFPVAQVPADQRVGAELPGVGQPVRSERRRTSSRGGDRGSPVASLPLADQSAGGGAENAEGLAVEPGQQLAVGAQARCAVEGVLDDVQGLEVGDRPDGQRPAGVDRRDPLRVEEVGPEHGPGRPPPPCPYGRQPTIGLASAVPNRSSRSLAFASRSRTAAPSGPRAIGFDAAGSSIAPSARPPARSNRSNQRGWPSDGSSAFGFDAVP